MLDITIKPKITKNLILSKYSEEQIMEYYLGIKIRKGLFRSPLRNDKHPTCSFFRNNSNSLIFKDFATGQYLNCFGVVMEKFKCDYYKALRIIANDFNIVHDNIPKNKGTINPNPVIIKDKEMAKIQVEVQPFSEHELKWWGKYGITEDILKHFNIYSCRSVFLNDSLVAQSQQHCPIYGYYGYKQHGMELWRCYFPKRTSFRFLTNWPSSKIQGYDQLRKNGKILVITKSLKDVACLYSIGISAIAPCSETQFVSAELLEDLKTRFKYIVVLYDNDLTGISFMRKHKKEHPELLYTWIPRYYEAKDISDFYAKYGRTRTINLINNYIKNVKVGA